MATYTVADLVQNLEGRRRVGEEPPVLLLGAGASASAGLATMRRLYEAEGIAADASDAFEQFCARMRKRDDRERFRWLAGHLQQADAQPVTAGYRALAALCASHIFDVVLTANLDPLLEDAFSATLLKRRDYLVLINGVLRADRLPLLLLPGAPRVKVLKLHGDLFHRFMAWTPDEMERYLRDITPVLSKGLAMRDVLVVGYSLRDPAVRELALEMGGTVWYANPHPPAPEIVADLAERNARVITSPECEFESFFPALAAALNVPTAPGRDDAVPAPAPTGRVTRSARRATPREERPAPPAGAPRETADNLDEVQAATVGILYNRQPGHVAFTGFLLAEPRVIVTDGWVAGEYLKGRKDRELGIVTQSGERMSVRQIALVEGNAFGPMLFEAPPALKVAGLRLDSAPLAAGDPIDVAVGTNIRRLILEGGMTVAAAVENGMIDREAAVQLERMLKKRAGQGAADDEWRRFAIGHGRVRTGFVESIAIAPIVEPVRDMLQLELAVGPGSSGAAVVDARCAVRGLIVAGSTDPRQPTSYALPASWWGPRLPRV